MPDRIIAQNLGKQYHRYHANRPSTLQEAVVNGLRRLRSVDNFWALRDVSFELPDGRVIGIIGANGAGKSTLLRLISGVGKPDEGTVTLNGRIGALLELGAGFHPDLTGRENLFINGVISGLTRREVAQKFDDIVAFAELEEFIDSPLRTYSSGMWMRLGFAIAVHIEPDILLVDEVLAVGDASFQQKCLDWIHQIRARGCTILLVSHNMDHISRFCDEVIWLRSGRVVAQAATEIILDQYMAEMMDGSISDATHAQPSRPTTKSLSEKLFVESES